MEDRGARGPRGVRRVGVQTHGMYQPLQTKSHFFGFREEFQKSLEKISTIVFRPFFVFRSRFLVTPQVEGGGSEGGGPRAVVQGGREDKGMHLRTPPKNSPKILFPKKVPRNCGVSQKKFLKWPNMSPKMIVDEKVQPNCDSKNTLLALAFFVLYCPLLSCFSICR